MAEFLSALATEVGKVLIGAIREKWVQYSRVKKEVKKLRGLHEDIKICLPKADALQARDKDENRREWMLKMRDVAVEIEEIIDIYNIDKLRREEEENEEKNCIKRCVLSFKKLPHLREISEMIQLIRPKIEGFETEKQRYLHQQTTNFAGTIATATSSSNPVHPLRRVYLHTKEDYVVGLDETKATLIGELLRVDRERRVVSIVGMPGSGKTTLAKQVYISDKIKSHFECCTWADVSKDYSVKSVLSSLLKKIGVNVPDASEEGKLLKILHTFLKNKRYLVVLDDVWTTKDWDNFAKTFPSGKSGSKVILTSRDKRLALYADPKSQPVEPKMLSKEDSWALFCKRALNDNPANCPEELKPCGEKMVEKCGGLPLAILVLGGLLSMTNGSLLEWEKVQRNINWELGTEDQLKGIIDLSYDDLPYHLKSCFLYMSLFPEDYVVKKTRLLRLLRVDIGVSFLSIPDSIGNLRMLQTLHLRRSGGIELNIPDVLWRMEELRFLYIPLSGGCERHLRLDNLRNLHTVKGVNVGNWMKNPSTFTNMVKLHISAFSMEKMWEIPTFVDGIPSLRSLRIHLRCDDNESSQSTLPLRFNKMSRSQLVELDVLGISLACRARTLPHAREFPPNLTTLRLSYVKLEEDPMPTLEKLPNLAYLHLKNSYKGKFMVCKAQMFSRLQYLCLDYLHLKEWIVEEGAMPRLYYLAIEDCQNLKKVPEGLRFLSTLQALRIYRMSDPFKHSLSTKMGKAWSNVIRASKVPNDGSEMKRKRYRR